MLFINKYNQTYNFPSFLSFPPLVRNRWRQMKVEKFNICCQDASRCYLDLQRWDAACCCCFAPHNNPSAANCGKTHLTEDIRGNQTKIKGHQASRGDRISRYVCVTAPCKSSKLWSDFMYKKENKPMYVPGSKVIVIVIIFIYYLVLQAWVQPTNHW